MLRLTMEFLPQGDESRTERVGTLDIINTGRGTEESGEYRARLTRRRGSGRLVVEEGSVFGFPRKKRHAWDLAFLALRSILAWRNPYRAYPRDQSLYVRRGAVYVPVAPFEGFPRSGVFLVDHHGDRAEHQGGRDGDDSEVEAGPLGANYRWIGAIPEADALTHAAAQVHHERACRALAALKNRVIADSLNREEIAARLNAVARGAMTQGECDAGLYSWTEPSIGDVVGCVLGAFAEGELAAEVKNDEGKGGD